MKKATVYYSDLICLNCGNIFTISRIKSGARPIGHIKELWCYRCNAITKHYEVQDADKFVCDIYNNEIKEKIKNLIIENNERYNGRKDNVFKKILTK